VLLGEAFLLLEAQVLGEEFVHQLGYDCGGDGVY